MTTTVRAAALATITAAAMLVGACGSTDPCATLPPPSAADVDAAAGDEVERYVGCTECEWTGAAWVADDDSAFHSRSSSTTTKSARPSPTRKSPPTSAARPTTRPRATTT